MTTSREQNGGYYAIKGFTYQFDKSLLEILRDTDGSVEIENVQDIRTDSYYIQVKHKEKQEYADSKIRSAIIQLIECSIRENKATKLYCYFVDKKVESISLDIAHLNKILGKEKSKFNDGAKLNFINNFVLEFSTNFDDQFKQVVAKIKTAFDLKTDEEAVTYHAIFRSHLIDIALKKNVRHRKISYSDLGLMLKNKERVIFEVAHSKYLTATKYFGYIKKEYFTHKKANIPSHERLFVIEVDSRVKDPELTQIISNIRIRYHKKNTSPAPYVCLYGIDGIRLRSLKQKLWDNGMFFSDGTHFQDDKFRIEDLIEETHKNDHVNVTFKLISFDSLPILLKKSVVDEAFVFLTAGDGEWRKVIKDFKEFYIGETRNVLKIILS